MKSRIVTYTIAMTVFAALTTLIPLAAQEQEQTHYFVKDLGTLGGTSGVAEGISNRGWVVGQASVAGNQSSHAFLWRNGVITDLGTLGGLNSAFNFPEKVDGEFVAGFAETSQTDPLAENFCGFGTGLICVPFLWENGAISQLPTLGGNNGNASNINHLGQIVGFAETSSFDITCVPPQQLNIRGVVWGPNAGQMQVLPPFPGDDASTGIAINDSGQAIGQSGACVAFQDGSGASLQRGVIWENGIPTDIGGLGGSVPYTFPWAINNKGQVIGQSNAETALFGPIVHAFLWQKGIMTDLGVLPNFNFISASFGFNDHGQVVGVSLDTSFNAHGFIWQDGVMTDLNDLIKPGSIPWEIVFGNDINDKGEIAAFAFDQSKGELRAVLLVPCNEQLADIAACAETTTGAAQATSKAPAIPLPENVREQLRKRLPFRRLGAPPIQLAPNALASGTWYVDGVNGNDTNDCKSPTAACKTIGHAISLAASGDTLNVAAATYTENLTISISLNIIGADAATTIIDGGGVGSVVTISNTAAHVSLSKVTIQHGFAVKGGGISNAGILAISNSIVSGNRVFGGGFQFPAGGGIFNAHSGTVTINKTTLTGNSASGLGPSGGGIANPFSGKLTINNSTLSGNSASGAYSTGEGGGISGGATINNSTISGNWANQRGGGLLGQTVTISNSIVANSPSGGNCFGTIISNGYNLSSDGTCNFSGPGDLNNTDPMLGALQNNGGPTQTMALRPGSPAIDSGNPSGCTDGQGHLLKTDQRGAPRPDKEDTGGCDRGAYERQSD